MEPPPPVQLASTLGSLKSIAHGQYMFLLELISKLISKFNVGLKAYFRDGLSEPVFYGDLVYKFKNLIGRSDFYFQFRKNIIHIRYKRMGY